MISGCGGAAAFLSASIAQGFPWTARAASAASSWVSVAYGSSVFVAVGLNAVMTSPDGVTWTSRTTPEANDWRSIVYGNGVFVAVASTVTNRVMTAP